MQERGRENWGKMKWRIPGDFLSKFLMGKGKRRGGAGMERGIHPKNNKGNNERSSSG